MLCQLSYSRGMDRTGDGRYTRYSNSAAGAVSSEIRPALRPSRDNAVRTRSHAMDRPMTTVPTTTISVFKMMGPGYVPN